MRVSFLIAMLVVGGCSRGPELENDGVHASPDGFLPAGEILSLLVAGPVMKSPANAVYVFRPDGTYLYSGRVQIWGRYRVADGVLCTTHEQREERCQSVFRDAQGQLFLGDHAGSKHPALPIEFVAIGE
ncbi:MAG: hypothetical protein ACK4JY_13995 [Brevundimonas sp.]|uniref:hypothetical protein n=1 Tax=Brevundimonas sp. TaxID=1871086 RepID=UPI00391A8746